MRKAGIAFIASGALAAGLSLPAGSSAAVTIGPSLPQPGAGVAGAGGGVTFVQTALPTGVNASPIEGVAVRYRVQYNGWGDVRLRVLRPLGGGVFDAIGTSDTTSLNGPFDDVVREFPARVPIAVGDQIGIDANGNARIVGGFAGASYAYWSPALADPDPPSAPSTVGALPNTILTFNADVEPDADRDGFGDETQDLCPTDATTQGACPVGAPNPSKKKCKRKKKGAKGAEGAEGAKKKKKRKKCKRKRSKQRPSRAA